MNPHFPTQDDFDWSVIFPDSSLPYHSEAFEQWINNVNLNAHFPFDLESNQTNRVEAEHVIDHLEHTKNSSQTLTFLSELVDDRISEALIAATQLPEYGPRRIQGEENITETQLDVRHNSSSHDIPTPIFAASPVLPATSPAGASIIMSYQSGVDLIEANEGHPFEEVSQMTDTHLEISTDIDVKDAPEQVIGSFHLNGRFKCLRPGCARKTFARQAELKRHYNTSHASQKPAYWCQAITCPRAQANGGYAFTRKDKLMDHERKVHGGQ